MPPETKTAGIAERIAQLDWLQIRQSLEADGFARLAPLLSPEECADLNAMYEVGERFRRRSLEQ